MQLHKYSKLFLCIIGILLLASCAHKNAPTEEQIELQGEKFTQQSRSRTVQVIPEPYLGARVIPMRAAESPALNAHVTMRRKGTLANIASALGDMTSLSVQVSTSTPDSAEKKAPAQGAPAAASADADLEALLALPPSSGSASGGGKTLAVNYEGTVRGLLDHLATLSGYGWDYDAKSGSVVFAHMVVRTYTLLGAPGKITYDNKITNKSKENSATGSIGGSSARVSQTVSTADTSSQTAQTNSTVLNFDIWEDTEKVVKSLLSKKGSVVANQSAGTLTVRDMPDNIRQVTTFINDVNTRLSRQVALTVQVWSLELTDDSEAGLNLQLLFKNNDVAVVAGSLSTTGGLDTAAATIVSGKLKDSNGVLKALKQWGKATQVTSGGGVVMSNQPIPAMAIERHAYLAGVNTFQGDYGQTTEITPGEVTTGFAMTVIPHILDRRRVILQYNINLSALKELKEFKTEDIAVQLPQVSTRAFSQRTTMKMGQTLVLAGFKSETQGTNNAVGILSGGRKANYGKTLLVITIELESAEV